VYLTDPCCRFWDVRKIRFGVTRCATVPVKRGVGSEVTDGMKFVWTMESVN
jgi:hypothetical protein